VQRAADRREHWVNMVVNDPEFLLGKYHQLLYCLGFQQGSLPLFHTANFKFPRLQPPWTLGLDGFSFENFLGKKPT
jgi:hypothetical protein